MPTRQKSRVESLVSQDLDSRAREPPARANASYAEDSSHLKAYVGLRALLAAVAGPGSKNCCRKPAEVRRPPSGSSSGVSRILKAVLPRGEQQACNQRADARYRGERNVC